MSKLKIQERFTLDSAPEQVWKHLLDPTLTVGCLPGAEITGQDDERTYSGALKVRVGSLTMSYAGQVVFEEVDEAGRHLRLVGRGRERSGSGSADLTMESRLLPLDDGGTEVTVDAEVRLTGKIVRFGRGMIDAISSELFREFTERLAEQLRRAPEGARPGAAAAGPGAGGGTGSEEALTPEEVWRPEEELPLIPLLVRALRSWLRRLLGRR